MNLFLGGLTTGSWKNRDLFDRNFVQTVKYLTAFDKNQLFFFFTILSKKLSGTSSQHNQNLIEKQKINFQNRPKKHNGGGKLSKSKH